MPVLRFLMASFVLTGSIGLPFPALATEYYELLVGQSTRVFKGARRSCGTPPSWHDFRRYLPSTGIGRFSDGGTVNVSISTCTHRIAAREIYFTAERPGRISFDIEGNGVVITVLGPRGGAKTTRSHGAGKTDQSARETSHTVRDRRKKDTRKRKKRKKRRVEQRMQEQD